MKALMAGGLGYALGSNSAQQSAQQAPPYQQPYPYQAPPAAPQGQGAGSDSGKLAQLQLLGELHESGTLTDDEFERQKQSIPGVWIQTPTRRRRCTVSWIQLKGETRE